MRPLLHSAITRPLVLISFRHHHHHSRSRLIAMANEAPSSTSVETAISKKYKLDEITQRLTAKFADVTHLSPSAVADLQTEGSVVLVDVRTPVERAVSRLPQSLTIEEYEAREADYKAANTKVVAYCTVGYRSAQYAGELQKRGIDAANMAGSILAWTHEGLPLVEKDEQITNRVHVFDEKWALQGEGYEAVAFKHPYLSFGVSIIKSTFTKYFG